MLPGILDGLIIIDLDGDKGPAPRAFSPADRRREAFAKMLIKQTPDALKSLMRRTPEPIDLMLSGCETGDEYVGIIKAVLEAKAEGAADKMGKRIERALEVIGIMGEKYKDDLSPNALEFLNDIAAILRGDADAGLARFHSDGAEKR